MKNNLFPTAGTTNSGGNPPAKPATNVKKPPARNLFPAGGTTNKGGNPPAKPASSKLRAG